MKYWKLKTTIVSRKVISHMATGGTLKLSDVCVSKIRVIGSVKRWAFNKSTIKATETLFSVNPDGSRTKLFTAVASQLTAKAVNDHMRLMAIMEQRRSEDNLITQCTEATTITRCVAECQVPLHLITQYKNSHK